VDHHSDEIYIDEALFFFSAEILIKKNWLAEKAKPLYEKIIFNHQDIYFVEAEKVSKLRGDKNL
jgi:hypothetical protein